MFQTWNNAQACKQCLCKFYVFGVKFKNVPKFYIENAPAFGYDNLGHPQSLEYILIKFAFGAPLTVHTIYFSSNYIQ